MNPNLCATVFRYPKPVWSCVLRVYPRSFSYSPRIIDRVVLSFAMLFIHPSIRLEYKLVLLHALDLLANHGKLLYA